MQKPTLGRIVHYNNAGTIEPGLIVAVHNDECVSLVTWNSGGTSSSRSSVAMGEGEGRWNWPARV